MNHLQADKFNIAWFKLAEFVSRKEKEKALGIYRLLVHSISDEALAIQLEGDLLLAFNDEKSLQRYSKACDLYEREGRYIQAIAISEHCVTLVPESETYVLRLIALYERIKNTDKMAHYTSALIKSLLKKNTPRDVIQFIEKHECSSLQKELLCEQLITEILHKSDLDETTIKTLLAEIVHIYTNVVSPQRKLSFMSKLAALNQEAYNQACAYMPE